MCYNTKKSNQRSYSENYQKHSVNHHGNIFPVFSNLKKKCLCKNFNWWHDGRRSIGQLQTKEIDINNILSSKGLEQCSISCRTVRYETPRKNNMGNSSLQKIKGLIIWHVLPQEMQTLSRSHKSLCKRKFYLCDED